MKATRVGAETRLNQIVALVAEAQRSRAPIQALADRVSAWFVPTVVAVAILSFVLWLLSSGRSRASPMRWLRPFRCSSSPAPVPLASPRRCR